MRALVRAVAERYVDYFESVVFIFLKILISKCYSLPTDLRALVGLKRCGRLLEAICQISVDNGLHVAEL